jgi:chorismate-pyruvate lyase
MPKSPSTSHVVPAGPGLENGSLSYPLSEFYSRNGILLPPLEEIEPARMPEPYKSLLVHQHDMTSTLENFHGAPIHLRLVSRARRENEYFREVALLAQGREQPVEFGAIKINLDLFPEAACRQILEEHWPLGRILKEFEIRFTSQPRGFLRIASDKLIDRVLDLTGAHLLYGRRNTLWDPAGQPLAEIVEILPPA